MSISARHSVARTAIHGGEYTAHTRADFDILPGERIGRPVGRTRRRAIAIGSLAAALALGGGAAWLAPPGTLSEIAALVGMMGRAIGGAMKPAETSASRTPLPAAAPPTEAAPSSTLQTTAASDSGLPAAAAPAPPPATRAPPEPEPTEAAPPDDSPAPLPPPTVDRTDPYQVRATAVGLHPGLSRVLLARLSPADYRNAGVAIQTALAQTPDTAVLVWPRQRAPELALFQVRFVPGAAPTCRRYVVTVTKDGWLTTALPMEKCGLKPPPPAARPATRVEDRDGAAPPSGPARR